MIAPTIYTYGPDGVLTGSQVAIQSPRDLPGTWLMPAQSTTVAPPKAPAGQQAVFSTVTKTWGLQAIS
jgi:hypothetical protein